MMTEKKRDNATLEIAERMVMEARFGADHLIDPETYKMEINQDSACIAQQLYAEQSGIAAEEATEEPTDVAAPMESFEASEERGNTSVPTHGGAF